MPIPIGLSFRASQTCGSLSTSADLGRVAGTFGGGMTLGVTKAGSFTAGGLTGGSAATFFSSRVLAIFGDTTAADFSGSRTVFCFSSCIGVAGATFGRTSTGFDAISGAGAFETVTGAGFSIARFDSTLASTTAGAGGPIARFDSTLTSDIAGTAGSITRFDSTSTSGTTGTGVSITRFDSTFTSDTTGAGSFGEFRPGRAIFLDINT